MDWTYRDVAKMIDHSLLQPTLTVADLEAGCRLAIEYDVASVCILPYYLRRCAEILKGTGVKASTTVGFPHGGHATSIKLAEARQALAAGQKVKVIFENAYLKDEHKIALCEICGDLRADWVKTSTGYAPSGATLEDLRLMRRHSPAHVQVKAAGGVRDLDTLLAMRALGVTRCGASRTKEILDEARRRLAS
jgi:deoxyribose-phosphate aldolase